MAHAWMPEAMRIRAEADGGPLGGGAPRAVWLTLRSLAGAVSVQSAAQRLVAEHRPCHLIWDPLNGEIAQLISVLRAARALGGPDRLDWVPNRARRRAGERERRGPRLRADRRARLRLRAVHQRPAHRRRGDCELARLLGSRSAAGRTGSRPPGPTAAKPTAGRRRQRERRPGGLGPWRPLRRVAGPRVRPRGPRRDRHPPAHRQRAAPRAGACAAPSGTCRPRSPRPRSRSRPEPAAWAIRGRASSAGGTSLARCVSAGSGVIGGGGLGRARRHWRAAWGGRGVIVCPNRWISRKGIIVCRKRWISPLTPHDHGRGKLGAAPAGRCRGGGVGCASGGASGEAEASGRLGRWGG